MIYLVTAFHEQLQLTVSGRSGKMQPKRLYHTNEHLQIWVCAKFAYQLVCESLACSLHFLVTFLRLVQVRWLSRQHPMAGEKSAGRDAFEPRRAPPGDPPNEGSHEQTVGCQSSWKILWGIWTMSSPLFVGDLSRSVHQKWFETFNSSIGLYGNLGDCSL